MAASLRFTNPSFKDYFLILQVHPEADGAMVDAAYWHLARRYSEEAVADASAKQKLDDLNEAYSVLGSSERREEYTRLRASVLGEGALPVIPELPRPPQPLAIMERSRPKAREGADDDSEPRRGVFPFRVPAWQNALAAVVILTLASAGLASQVYPPLVLGLLIVGLALTSIPLVHRLPQLSRSLPAFSLARGKLPPLRRAPASEASTVPFDSDRLRASTEAMVARLRETSAAPPPREDHARSEEVTAAATEPATPSTSDRGSR